MPETMSKSFETPLALTLMIRLISIPFIGELVIDNLWPTLLPNWALQHYEIIDSTLLFLFCAPFVWWLVIQPLRRLRKNLAWSSCLLLFGKLNIITFVVELLMILLLPGVGYSDDLPLQLADAYLVCMGTAPLFGRVLRQFLEAQGMQEEVGSIPDPIIIMYKLVLITLLVEYYVMQGLSWLRPAAQVPGDAIIDAALLGLIISPFIWLLVVRPVRQNALEEQARCERLVAERTSELLQNTTMLQNLSRQVPGLLYQFRMTADGHFSLPYASDALSEFFETTFDQVHRDAAIIFARAHPDDLAGFTSSINVSAMTLQPWQHEFRIVLPKAGVRWCHGSSRPERQADGSIVWSGFLADVTEKKRLEEQLYEAKKLESIGQLAGGVAHEVRNPLNAILTITEALFREKELEDNQDLRPYILHIREQVSRLAQLMNDLLDLGKTIPVSNLQPLPLLEVCLDTLTLWQETGEAANRTWEIEGEQQAALASLVLADSRRLQQVLFNLLENAGHHAPPGTTVRFRHVGRDEAGAGPPMAVVQVIDSGCGIPPENIPRIFDPFFTNRRGGTGLGLALVRHFVEEMGGNVRIWNNNPPPGCTAEVRIPLALEVPQ